MFFENNLSLNNMERLSACSVKTIEADEKYEVEDTIILGGIGKDVLITSLTAIAMERFPDGAMLDVGTYDEKFNTFDRWASFKIDDSVAGDIIHLPIPNGDNANANGSAYTGEIPFSYTKGSQFYVKFKAVAPGNVGKVALVLDYSYIGNNQTGGYLR